jgi:hypothetical protein
VSVTVIVKTVPVLALAEIILISVLSARRIFGAASCRLLKAHQHPLVLFPESMSASALTPRFKLALEVSSIMNLIAPRAILGLDAAFCRPGIANGISGCHGLRVQVRAEQEFDHDHEHKTLLKAAVFHAMVQIMKLDLATQLACLLAIIPTTATIRRAVEMTLFGLSSVVFLEGFFSSLSLLSLSSFL